MLVLLLLCACSATLAVPTAEYYALEEAETHFELFMQEHNKHYANEDEKQVRFQIFKYNLERVNHMNAKSNHAVFGITKFMDMAKEEFAGTYIGTERYSDLSFYDCADLTDGDVPNVDAPESFDWRDQKVVTRVRNQGRCFADYAFSATGNIESQYAIKYKKLIELSAQQTLDCDDYSYGCDGGMVAGALTSIMLLGGIQTEDSYRYIQNEQKCRFNGSQAAVKLTGCNSYNLTSQEALKRLVYSVGPIAARVRAEEFYLYNGGIFKAELCTGQANNFLLIVGYGEEDGIPYWILKNSWGRNFGEGGYIRIERGEGLNPCEMMNEYMASAIVE